MRYIEAMLEADMKNMNVDVSNKMKNVIMSKEEMSDLMREYLDFFKSKYPNREVSIKMIVKNIIDYIDAVTISNKSNRVLANNLNVLRSI